LRTAILILAIGVFAIAAYGDVRARHIPNSLPLAIGALALVQLTPVGDPHPALWTIGAAVMIFVLGLLQWRLGLLGGGDVKLLAAAALLVGSHDLFDFLFLTSLGGAAPSSGPAGWAVLPHCCCPTPAERRRDRACLTASRSRPRPPGF